jgi:hypothetical protein
VRTKKLKPMTEEFMTKTWKLWMLGVAVGLAVFSCATQQQMLQQGAPEAEQTALQRGRFDLNCPGATASMLSQDFIQPAIQGPGVSGLQRKEYTIGVEGCGQRKVYVVICQEGTGTCFAANPSSGRL